MITEVPKTFYRCSDGMEFEKKEEAEQHERVQMLIEEFEGSPIYWPDTSAQEVAEYLVKNFDIKAKNERVHF